MMKQAIYLSTYIPDVNGNYIFSEAEEVLYYPLSYFGNAKPVIAYTNVIVFIAYRKNTTDGLYQKTKWNVASNWVWDTEGTIPNTTLYSNSKHCRKWWRGIFSLAKTHWA
ncbi:MAG: hypothetical protein HS131_06415 [Ignavibacteriales bacterium]|nr:hypothetical protein [Ignavibacteriales bacterium]